VDDKAAYGVVEVVEVVEQKEQVNQHVVVH
jgi:hypothetical protein